MNGHRSNEIARLTEEYGGQWGINHTRRLARTDHPSSARGWIYNSEAVWIAAHLHDWGAYAPWAEKEVEHALRSRQVADDFLTERNCPAELKALVLECIEFHHAGGEQSQPGSDLVARSGYPGFSGGNREYYGTFRRMPAICARLIKSRKAGGTACRGCCAWRRRKRWQKQRLREMDELLSPVRSRFVWVLLMQEFDYKQILLM